MAIHGLIRCLQRVPCSDQCGVETGRVASNVDLGDFGLAFGAYFSTTIVGQCLL